MFTVNRRQFMHLVGLSVAYVSIGTTPGSAVPIRDEKHLTEDVYWPQPQSTFEQRRLQYLQYCSANARRRRNGVFSQIARLELGKEPVDEEIFRDALAYVYSNRDCNDFIVAGFLRILYLYRKSPLISRKLIADIEECVLQFKYWWDGPGRDKRCYHTENHQIIFHGDELLAGQLYPDKIFKNSGKDGRYHIRHGLHLINRWIDFRVKFGFSEWLSNGYFDHDLMALANLRDFAEDADVRAKAEMLMDMLLFEISLHSYRGVFGSTHGRTYARMIKGGRGEHTATIAKLTFGMGMFNEPDSPGSVSLATSGYRCPAIIGKIASDLSNPILCKERHSINIPDAWKYGLSFDNVEDGHLYWSIQDYVHPSIIDLSRRMSATFGVRQFEKYEKYANQYKKQIEEHGKIVNPNLCHKALTEVHIQTYRTGDYLLSCAQDYRPGCGGYQQHIWQATLGLDAVVFTNHPGSDDEHARPNYWAGNGILPRAAQHRNVLICIYRTPPDDPFPFSHAYFPRNAFDEIIEDEHWIFARKDNGYIALYSQHKFKWFTNKQGIKDELRVTSPDNIWICELGNRSTWKSFDRFRKAVAAAKISCKHLDVQYQSPSLGDISFGWQGPFRSKGQPVALHDYKRFENPYCQSEFTDPIMHIKRGHEELHLDFKQGKRIISGNG
ncbi:MAG: hypothetical protein FVQ79_05215 [Planctomycetes bacterium]|nr:hypothetical protein [Planctomycetota bacterium]